MLTTGLAIEQSSSSTLMTFSQVFFAVILDAIFWGTLPKLTSILGGIVLMVALIVILLDHGAEGEGDVERDQRNGMYRADPEAISLEFLLPSEDSDGSSRE